MVQVNGATKNVGNSLSIRVGWQNTGDVNVVFLVGVSIGKQTLNVWHDVDIFTDGIGEFASQLVAVGALGDITRTMTVPNDLALLGGGAAGDYAWDVWVSLRDPEDPSIVLDEYMALGALTVHVIGPPDGQILAITLL